MAVPFDRRLDKGHNFYVKCTHARLQELSSAVTQTELQLCSVTGTQTKVNIVCTKPNQLDPREVCSSLVLAGPAEVYDTSTHFTPLYCVCWFARMVRMLPKPSAKGAQI